MRSTCSGEGDDDVGVVGMNGKGGSVGGGGVEGRCRTYLVAWTDGGDTERACRES